MDTIIKESNISFNDIGDRIKIIRQKVKKNQKTFAEELGLSQSHISNIEKGNDKPSLTLIKLICLKYEISENWLLYGDGDISPYTTWDLSDEGLYAKYISFKKEADKSINELVGEDRQNFVDAYCFFLTIAHGIKLEGEERSQYIKLIYDFMNHLERMMFATTSYETLFLTKKVDYKSLFRYVSTCYDHIAEMDKSIKRALNVYVSKYKLPYIF